MQFTRKNMTFGLLAIVAIVALFAIAGHPLVDPAILAGLSFMPMVSGETSLIEIKSIIEAQGRDLETWKSKQDGKFNELQSYAEQLEVKFNRQGLGGYTEGAARSGGPEMKAFTDYMRTGRESSEFKSMSVSNDTTGGYLAPAQLELELTKYLRARSPMRQIARVVPVGGGEYKMPRATTGAAYAWTAETASRPETSSPDIGMLTITTNEVYCSPAISQNLLDDNLFNLEEWIVAEVGEAFGDAEGAAFITGDGIGKPRGLFTYDVVSTADATRGTTAFQYVPTGGAGSVATADPFISLVYAVKPQYRQNASWLLSGEVLEVVRKLKDGEGNYLWAAGLQAGQPSTLLGYPVYEDENVPAIAANSLSAAFGDFRRGYTITDRSMAMLRDPYSNKPFVSFYTVKRLGGGAGRDNRAVKFLKFSAS